MCECVAEVEQGGIVGRVGGVSGHAMLTFPLHNVGLEGDPQ